MPGNVIWAPGINDKTGNLLGTIRTLDGVDGSINLDCQTQGNPDLHCTYGYSIYIYKTYILRNESFLYVFFFLIYIYF